MQIGTRSFRRFKLASAGRKSRSSSVVASPLAEYPKGRGNSPLSAPVVNGTLAFGASSKPSRFRPPQESLSNNASGRLGKEPNAGAVADRWDLRGFLILQSA